MGYDDIERAYIAEEARRIEAEALVERLDNTTSFGHVKNLTTEQVFELLKVRAAVAEYRAKYKEV